VRSFLEKPGERSSNASESSSPKVGEVGEDLQGRHAALSRRLAAKRNEKGRFVKLYAQGLVDDEELEAHLADLKNQVENLKMLIASVEADLEDKDEEALVARSTEAWGYSRCGRTLWGWSKTPKRLLRPAASWRSC